MPRSRTPLAKARIEGRHIVHPERYAKRIEPASEPLGEPPTWLNTSRADAFMELRNEIPWLRVPHTAHTVIAAILLEKVIAGVASIPEMNLLRLCLAQMGATPVTAGKIQQPTADTEDDDLLGPS